LVASGVDTPIVKCPVDLNAKVDQTLTLRKVMFASDYSRAERLVNGSTENFSKKHGVIPVQIGISPTLPTGLDFSLRSK
jgi:hypothetical protein